MKLSSREKNMLVFFSIMLIGVAVYFFVVQPIHEKHDIAKEEYNTVDAQYRIVKTQIKKENEIDEIIGDYRDRLAILDSKLPPQIYLEKIIDDMFNHFESYDIVMDTVTFNLIEANKNSSAVVENNDGSLAIENLRPVMSVEEILDSYEAEENLAGILVVDGEEITYDYKNIGYMNVNMSFVSNYSIFKDALESLSLLDMTAIPNNVSLTKSDVDEEDRLPDNNEVYVALSVAIPFYYDNEVLEDIFFDYEFEAPTDFEEHGPFEYTIVENDNVGSSSGTSNPVKRVNADFNIAIRNSVSDLAAQSLTYANIAASRLELDANKNERYILDITESGTNLAFKYSNDNASYPTGSGYEVLTPKSENIVIKVDSSTRFNGDDDSGITLILNNKSSRKVFVYVSNDDPNNPRFNIIVNSGAFEVIRN
ncbi:MAG: type II secretion system protein M [Clostridiales bacterium]|nr:type II secretion system protein M [Clostridiales bacterium]